MNALDRARAVIAGAAARRVATDPQGIIVSPTTTERLARRAVGGAWWDQPIATINGKEWGEK